MNRMCRCFKILCIFVLQAVLLSACTSDHSLEGTHTPANGKTALFIGQDLDSIQGYIQSDLFPMPYGLTSYLNFYGLCSPTISNYGGLCMDNNMNPTGGNADWGAGALNGCTVMTKYPDCALSIGLYLVENESYGWTLSGIAEGKFNKEIDKLAAYISMAKRPVFLRIGYEFDGIWNHYPTETYKQAYRTLVERIRNKDINGDAGEYLVSVWQACSSPSNDKSRGAHAAIEAWYPGDDVVDWVGCSYFVPGWQPEKPESALTQEQLADEVLDFAREHGKPVMIAEAAPQGFDLDAGTQKAVGFIDGKAGTLVAAHEENETGAKVIWNAWYQPFFSYIKKNRDIIRAVSYINANWDIQPQWAAPYSGGYWGDSRLEANEWIAKWWKEEISSSNW